MAMLRDLRKGTMTQASRSQLLAVCLCVLAVAALTPPTLDSVTVAVPPAESGRRGHT